MRILQRFHFYPLLFTLKITNHLQLTRSWCAMMVLVSQTRTKDTPEVKISMQMLEKTDIMVVHLGHKIIKQ